MSRRTEDAVVAEALGQHVRESLVGAAGRVLRDPHATAQARAVAQALMGPGDPWERLARAAGVAGRQP